MTQWANVVVRRTVTSVIFVWAISGVAASASPILSISPASSTVNVGQTVTLNFDITDVVNLFSFNFDLLFDDEILQFQSMTEGSLADPSGFFGDALPHPDDSGRVTGIGNLWPSLVTSDGGRLAIARFTAIGPGTSLIDIVRPEFVDLFNPDPITLDQNSVYSASVTVNASAVPDAPSPVVLAVSVLALVLCRKFTDA